MVIEILYPQLCNLFGDRGNVEYLKKNLPEATFIETGLNEQPYFVENKVDMIYLGPSSEKSQELFVNRLMPYKARLASLIEDGTVFLLTGNAAEVFGTKVSDKDGSGFEGLNLLELQANRNMFGRKNSLYMGEFENIKIVGFQSQFTTMESNEEPFCKTEFGLGRNETSRCEGIHVKNVFATYLIGPILVLNPLFTKYLLSLLGVENKKLYLEDETMEAYQLRVEDFYRAQKIQHIK